MLTLPETLLLFALHDERGAVHATAFLGIDEALAGAVLGELLLRGMVRIRQDGALRLPEEPPDCDSMLLLLANKALIDAGSDTVEDALGAVEKHLSHLRKRTLDALVMKKIVTATSIDRDGLADTDVHPMSDNGAEAQMLRHVREGIPQGAGVSRRIGLLIGLVHVLDLWSTLLPEAERSAARTAGDWVLENSPICRATRVLVKKADGTWEG